MSVNRYGTQAYRDWRAKVHASSIVAATWAPPSLFAEPCAVHIRYFRHGDSAKDVDNILKAILDGLDGKVGGHPKASLRVLDDDRTISLVTSQRTDLKIHTAIDVRGCHRHELTALVRARRSTAAVFVFVGPPPDQTLSVTP